MNHHVICPVCSSDQLINAFAVKDYTVSAETYSLVDCANCTLRFTQDTPEQSQISKYYKSENYISHSDTQKGLINRLYHRVRNTTLQNKRRLIVNETGMDKGSVLDIGCGTGAFLHTMEQKGWTVTGLEPDEQARAKALALYRIKPAEIGAVFTLPAAQYDAITMWHVLEHVHQLHEYIHRCKELLAKNGRLFIAVPNYTSKDAEYYKHQWAAYDVPRHLYHFSAESMHQLVNLHGLKIEKMARMWYDSFYVSMLSEQYKTGKVNYVKAVAVGLLSNIRAVFNRAWCSSIIYVISKN